MCSRLPPVNEALIRAEIEMAENSPNCFGGPWIAVALAVYFRWSPPFGVG
jgi:hypothetical protein